MEFKDRWGEIRVLYLNLKGLVAGPAVLNFGEEWEENI